MRTLAGLLLLAIPTSLAIPAVAAAQATDSSAASEDQVRFRIGGGIGTASLSSGGASASSAGAVFGAQVAIVRSPTSDLTIDVLAQPFRVQNPNRDEAYRATFIMFGWQPGSAGQTRVYGRPALGLVVRPWTGTDVFVASEMSIGLGFAFGVENTRPKGTPLAVEWFALLSGADELGTTLIGVTVSVSTARRRATR